jgi:hypothetical protein
VNSRIAPVLTGQERRRGRGVPGGIIRWEVQVVIGAARGIGPVPWAKLPLQLVMEMALVSAPFALVASLHPAKLPLQLAHGGPTEGIGAFQLHHHTGRNYLCNRPL